MKILILSCGGTIISPAGDGSGITAIKARDEAASYMVDELRRYEYFEPRMKRKFGSVPEFGSVFITDTDSTNVGPAEWKLMIDAIVENYDDYDGFMLAHGTNSLAYTASALSFGLPNLGKPVIVTGSNVAMGLPWSDGPANASNAILAIGRMSENQLNGVFTVFANKIIAGVRTKKASGVKLEAFRTFSKEEDVGKCIKDEPRFNTKEYESYRPWLTKETDSPWKTMKPARYGRELKKINTEFSGIISSHTFHPGDDPEIYRLVINELARRRKEFDLPGGMIIRAVGDGDVSLLMQEKVFPHARENEIPIAVTTQEPQGVSSFSFNEQSAGAEDAYGIIPAHDMSIETMVIKLRYLMSTRASYEEIHTEFKKNYLGEIDKSEPDEALYL